MTTTEQLQKIKTECQRLLAIAEKRTAGKWGIERTTTTNWIGPMRRNGDGKISIIVCDTDRDRLKAEYIDKNDSDADFIAACAGPAEAGWRATIAAIDAIFLILPQNENGWVQSYIRENDHAQEAERLASVILTAWEGIV